MKFNLNDFMQLDVSGLLEINGGSYCSGASNGTTIYPNPYYRGGSSNPGGGGGNGDKNPIETAGSCSNINLGKYVNKENNDSGLTKVSNGIAYPVGDEYSDKFVVTDVFGPRDPVETANGVANGFHTGIDISAPEGTRINSIGDGFVSEVTAGIGLIVSAGQKIATVGSTGMSTGSHLHLSYDGDGDGYYTNSEADNPNTLLSR